MPTEIIGESTRSTSIGSSCESPNLASTGSGVCVKTGGAFSVCTCCLATAVFRLLNCWIAVAAAAAWLPLGVTLVLLSVWQISSTCSRIVLLRLRSLLYASSRSLRHSLRSVCTISIASRASHATNLLVRDISWISSARMAGVSFSEVSDRWGNVCSMTSVLSPSAAVIPCTASSKYFLTHAAGGFEVSVSCGTFGIWRIVPESRIASLTASSISPLRSMLSGFSRRRTSQISPGIRAMYRLYAAEFDTMVRIESRTSPSSPRTAFLQVASSWLVSSWLGCVGAVGGSYLSVSVRAGLLGDVLLGIVSN